MSFNIIVEWDGHDDATCGTDYLRVKGDHPIAKVDHDFNKNWYAWLAIFGRTNIWQLARKKPFTSCKKAREYLEAYFGKNKT